MEGKNVKKSLFVRLFEVVIRFILHFRIPILVLIILGTLFFAYALFSLQIDALPLQHHMLKHRHPLQRENLSTTKSLMM